MKANKILLLSAFIMILCCIGAVSAADDIADAVNDDKIGVDSLEDTFQYSNDEVAVENNNVSATLKTEENEMGSDSINSPLSQDNYSGVCGSENMVLNDSVNINHVYVSPDGDGNGTLNNQSSLEYAIDNIQDNTIIHMADGFYNLNSTLSIHLAKNTTIIADHPGKVFITGGNINLDYLIELYGVYNFTFKNIIVRDTLHKNGFILVTGNRTYPPHLYYDVTYSNKIFFENCSFINCTKGKLLDLDVKASFSLRNCFFSNNSLTNVLNLPSIVNLRERLSWHILDTNRYESNIVNCTFENNILQSNIIFIQLICDLNICECNFINNSFNDSDIYITYYPPGSSVVRHDKGLINIVDCEFNNIDSTIPAVHVNRLGPDGMIFDNNIVNSKYGIVFDESSLSYYNNDNHTRYPSELHSATYIHVLNENVVAPGYKINITAIIVDDMDNVIRIPNLKLIIFGEVYPTTFVDGAYLVEYTVPDYLGLVNIDVDYTSVISGVEFSHLDSEMCIPVPSHLLIKPAVNFILDNISSKDYGENITVNVNLPSLESGNITYLIMSNGEVIKKITKSFKDNISVVLFENLSAGNYTIKILYYGNENYAPSSITSSFTINKVNPSIQLLADDFVNLGEGIIVQAILPADASGNVYFKFNGVNKSVPVINGVAKTRFNAITQNGNYTLIAGYCDNNYNYIETNLTIKNKIDSYLNLTYTPPIASEDVTISIVMNDEINDNVTVVINGKSENKTLINGRATVILSKVNVNEIYTISVNYEGKGKFKAASNSTTFKVYKLDTSISTSAKPVQIGEDVIININVDSKATGIIVVNNKYSSVIKNGVALIHIPGLSIGNYTYTVVYSGDARFNSNQTNVTFKVEKIRTNPIINVNDIVVGEVTNISVDNLPKEATGTLTFTITGLNPKTVNVGETYSAENLVNGTYTVVVVYSGDSKYAGFSVNKTFAVKIDCSDKATVSDIDALTTANNIISIALPDDARGTFEVIIDGKSINTTITNGKASIPISGLSAGKHNIIVSYSGDGKYAGYSVSKDVVVSKIILKATIAVPTGIYEDNVFTVRISLPGDADGKVSVEVGSKKYDANVVKGVALVKVAGLKAGTHVLKYTYKGNAKYSVVSGSSKLKVKSPKITVSLKKVSVKRSAKKLILQSTVKIDNKAKKGLKVTFKFNGKKYSAKTNAKGIAKVTVKKAVLKKLKAGKKITYTASYAKVTAKKTVKIGK